MPTEPKGTMRELGLFAGAGGGLLASRLLGWDTVCAVEINPHCQRVLCQRQLDGCLNAFPIWDDIRTFDGRPWAGCIDVVSGGFPCQDISSAGRGAGLAGDRSGLWFEMLRVIGEVRPAYVFAENSPMLRTRGLGVVLAGLTDLGYDAAWGVLGAGHVGAPHERARLWIVAHAAGMLRSERVECRKAYDGRADAPDVGADAFDDAIRGGSLWVVSEAESHRVAHDVADRVERVRATGNGQVPAVAALAWEVLSSTLEAA